MNMIQASRRQISILRNMRRKKYRHEQELFLAEGERTVTQILENDRVETLSVFIDETVSGAMAPLFNQEIYMLPHEIFIEVSDTEHPQGVLALCRTPKPVDSKIWNEPDGCLIALDGLRDPGNMGTVIRTASWFGAAGLVLSHDTVDPFHPKVVRSTAGATGSLPYASGDLTDILGVLSGMGWKILFLEDRPDAVSMNEGFNENGVVLVVGNEAHGIRLDRSGISGRSVMIPKGSGKTEVESLNAAVAASIAMYEFAIRKR